MADDLDQYAIDSICPSEIRPEHWAQMSNDERQRVRTALARLWYRAIGKHMTDEEWVAMLTRRKP